MRPDFGPVIYTITGKAQQFFHKSPSSLCYRLLEAFAVIKIMRLVAQRALTDGRISAGGPGPIGEGGVWIFVHVGDKTGASGIRWWQLLLVLRRDLWFGHCSRTVEHLHTVNWVICSFACFYKFGQVSEICKFSVFSYGFHCTFTPLWFANLLAISAQQTACLANGSQLPCVPWSSLHSCIWLGRRKNTSILGRHRT